MSSDLRQFYPRRRRAMHRRSSAAAAAAAAAMSPLARSLLVLATLLAVAGALANPSCSSVVLGPGGGKDPYNSTQEINNSDQASGTVNIPDKCTDSEKHLVSQDVGACSKGGSAPHITVMGNRFSPVVITCPEDAGGCPVVELYVMQYCAFNKHTF
ncbi:uncharacterized protein LOC125227630 [Leguminivora glycinivorella]|uniref:uncharacterized protein LOC125227630 n=1 Tax=Leguminivora glycinivorella TaxID=1035111 RepID=UPI00200BE60D|nr:uncharacterized protein LOC125227630 [Leguminivora glycinivorella]